MIAVNHFWIFSTFFITYLIIAARANSREEFCAFEQFEATCSYDEVIIMHTAQYGQNRIGKCIKEDIGHMGCGTDVMYILDEHCSGKQSCSMHVGENELGGKSTCPEWLKEHLEAIYVCKKVIQLETTQCNQPNILEVTEPNALITTEAMRNYRGSCYDFTKQWKLQVSPGQYVNITLIDYDHGENDDGSYGEIEDVSSNSLVVITSEDRHKHILETTGRELEITLHSIEFNFALEIEVLGCADISPPDGAWTTRDGDVMEIGCHSGAKSWTLACEDNQWIGAIGFCGTDYVKSQGEDNAEKFVTTIQKQASLEISINVMVFGACSIILLLSSIIFLIGVLLLKRPMSKRKLDTGDERVQLYHDTTMFPENTHLDITQGTIMRFNVGGQDAMIHQADYKSLVNHA